MEIPQKLHGFPWENPTRFLDDGGTPMTCRKPPSTGNTHISWRKVAVDLPPETSMENLPRGRTQIDCEDRRRRWHLLALGWWDRIWLVVATKPSEKYEPVGMMTFPTELKNTKCSKPPTRYQCSSINFQKWGYHEGYLYKIQKHSARYSRYMIIFADVRKISYH